MPKHTEWTVRRKITPFVVADIERHLHFGTPMLEIARLLRVSVAVVRTIRFDPARKPKRTVGRRKSCRKWTAEETEKLADLWRDGTTAPKIAVKLGRSFVSVRRKIHAMQESNDLPGHYQQTNVP